MLKTTKNGIGFLLFIILFAASGLHAQAAGGYREFLNDRNRPDTDHSGDNREVFHIVEVIPHDACSIFPYLIDWKTEEEYNNNVPIGYEGLIYGTSHTGNIQIFEGDKSKPSRAYGVVEDGLKRDFLSNYEVTFTTKYDKNTGYWWREDDTKKKIDPADGYFEYVGAGKGLYYINTDMVKGKSGAKNGIAHEMQALQRSGQEKGKGEYEVKDARYYWAKDYSGQRAYPTEDIKSRTGLNYDLIFRQKSGIGAYRVYEAAARPASAETAKSGYDYRYDYLIKAAEGTEEKYTFEKYKGGNYNKSGASYVYAGAGKGSYVLEREAVLKGISWASQSELTFEYAGMDMGIYNVSFIYASSESPAALYEASVREVTNGMGRYALTSASGIADASGAMMPEYEEKTGGDYSRIITRIDFAGIDYTDTVNGYYATTAPYGAGVRIGRSQSDYTKERGDWVFHELSETSGGLSAEEPEDNGEGNGKGNTNGYTKLKDVEGKHTFAPGDRIYVTKQARVYRYYCRNSFRNNEWFKLMCYLDNPKDPSLPYGDNSNGMGYDLNLTSAENLTKAKQLLNSFDNTFRIEVIQRTPGELTKEEVEQADLLYISDAAGIESLVQEWGNVSRYLEANGQTGLAPLPEGVRGSKDFRFKEDLSNEAMLAIYDRCIYKNEGALMVTVSLRENYMQNGYSSSVKNLGKLTFFMDLMEDARDFAYFIEGYEESAESNFNLIHQYQEGDVLGIEVWPKQMGYDKYGSYKEMYNVAREGESGIDGCFNIYHFEVPWSSSGQAPGISWKGSEYTGHSSVGKVLEDETKYYSHWYAVSSFNKEELHKIWQILHNRKNKGKIIVQITNAHLTLGQDKERVIYADEFDPASFDVKYKILLKGVMQEYAAPLADTLIFFDDNDNGVYDNGELCYTNTGQKYNTEDDAHKRNVRSGFEDPASGSDPKQLAPDRIFRKVVIQATDLSGRTGSSDVWVIIREGFDLN